MALYVGVVVTVVPEPVGIPDNGSCITTCHCVSVFPAVQTKLAVVGVIPVAVKLAGFGSGQAGASSIWTSSIITIPVAPGFSIVGDILNAI